MCTSSIGVELEEVIVSLLFLEYHTPEVTVMYDSILEMLLHGWLWYLWLLYRYTAIGALTDLIHGPRCLESYFDLETGN